MPAFRVRFMRVDTVIFYLHCHAVGGAATETFLYAFDTS